MARIFLQYVRDVAGIAVNLWVVIKTKQPYHGVPPTFAPKVKISLKAFVQRPFKALDYFSVKRTYG